MRRQEEGESVDSFITSLYRLAEHCNYRDLHNEMIRDRIVVGLRDAALSERLQTDSELTLDKAITMARQTEAVKEQQPVVRGEVENSRHARVEAVHGVQSLQQKQSFKNNPTKNRLLVSNLLKLIRRDAPDVAKFPTHPRNQCPTREAKCHKCGKQGHYQSMCRSTSTVATIRTGTVTEEVQSRKYLHTEIVTSGWLSYS